MKKTLIVALLTALVASGAFAANADCEAKAVSKDGKPQTVVHPLISQKETITDITDK